ncbi:7433_t:CDS:1, partial [Paraglomus brasilianum]
LQRYLSSNASTHEVRGIFEAIKPMESLSVEDLVRIWSHEALRLFQDRLVTEEERKWTDDNIDSIAMKHFPSLNQDEALGRPILSRTGYRSITSLLTVKN